MITTASVRAAASCACSSTCSPSMPGIFRSTSRIDQGSALSLRQRGGAVGRAWPRCSRPSPASRPATRGRSPRRRRPGCAFVSLGHMVPRFSELARGGPGSRGTGRAPLSSTSRRLERARHHAARRLAVHEPEGVAQLVHRLLGQPRPHAPVGPNSSARRRAARWRRRAAVPPSCASPKTKVSTGMNRSTSVMPSSLRAPAGRAPGPASSASRPRSAGRGARVEGVAGRQPGAAALPNLRAKACSRASTTCPSRERSGCASPIQPIHDQASFSSPRLARRRRPAAATAGSRIATVVPLPDRALDVALVPPWRSTIP